MLGCYKHMIFTQIVHLLYFIMCIVMGNMEIPTCCNIVAPLYATVTDSTGENIAMWNKNPVFCVIHRIEIFTLKKIRSHICKLHKDIIYPSRLCTVTSCCARTDRSTQQVAHFTDFSTSNEYATDLVPCPKFFKEWQPCFPIISLKSDNKIMVFNWKRFPKPCGTSLALLLCCITAPWQDEVETELCQLPLLVGKILWSCAYCLQYK